MEKFLPIILGSDMNTYTIAREIHEFYGIKSAVATSTVLLPCIHSKIIDVYQKDNFSKDPEIFVEVLNDIYNYHKDTHEQFIIFAPDDVMRTMLLENQEKLAFEALLPYASKEISDKLKTKKEFYEGIKDLGLAPLTLVATPENYMDIDYPVDCFIKADNDVAYKKLDFDGWQKGYHSKSVEDTIAILENIFANGYTDGMIVQPFVTGGDGTEYSVDGYRSKESTSMAICKNVMLDKRPEWIGNFVAKIDTDKMEIFDYANQILDALGVYGLFNIDFKENCDTGKLYAFEINLRQGRCHYYATQNGVNTSMLAIEDLVSGRGLEQMGHNKFAYYTLDLDETLNHMPADLLAEFTDPARMDNLANPLIYEVDVDEKRMMKINPYLEKLSNETFKYTEV